MSSKSRTDTITILLTLAYLAAVLFTGFRLGASNAASIGIIAVVIVGGDLLLAWWRASHYAYACTACGKKYTVSVWRDFWSFHWMSRKFMVCPRCGKRAWASEAERS